MSNWTGSAKPVRTDGERPSGEVRTFARTAQEVMRDPARVAALRRTQLLDSPFDQIIDRLTRIAARTLQAPVALFTLLDEERQFCKSCVGLPDVWVSGRDSPLAYSFCQHAVATGMPLVVEDSRTHPLVHSDPATLRGVIAYAGVPLITSDRHAIGTLCVIDFRPRTWLPEEVEVLEELADAVISRIELRTAVREAEEKAREAERAQEALRESELRFRTAFDAAPIGMALVATDGRWIRVNDALCAILGYSREELLARTSHEVTHPDDLATDLTDLELLLDGTVPRVSREKRYVHRNGGEVWVQLNVSLVRDSRGEPFHLIAQIQDIAERKREEDRLRHLSFRDELTDLYNRRAFLAMAGERMKLARRQGRDLLLLFADVDGMKWINDTYGHAEGDRALVAAAALLRQTFRESDLLARLGGDEFAVLADPTPDVDTDTLLIRFNARMHALNLATADRPYRLNMSIGAAGFSPTDPSPIEELIQRADVRMYQAKARRSSA